MSSTPNLVFFFKKKKPSQLDLIGSGQPTKSYGNLGYGTTDESDGRILFII